MSSLTPSSSQAPAPGKKYWRSLSDLHNTPEFEEFLHREFPEAASEFPHGVSRRRWLQLMGASFALAGVTQAGCRWEKENIFPEAARPMNRIPGVPVKYATASELSGVGAGLLVTSYDGRPIKVDGNPQHPQNSGASGVFTQATILQMYDPDRSQAPAVKGEPGAKSWAEAQAALKAAVEAQKDKGGAGLRVLAEPSSSPTLAALRKRLIEAFPQAEWVDFEPLARENVRAGSELAFGAPHRTHLNIDQADVIVCLDADLFQGEGIGVKYARQFGAGRIPTKRDGRADMNRLYVVDSYHSITGAMADHHLPVRSEQILPLGMALEAAVFAAVDAAEAEKFGKTSAAPTGEFLAEEEIVSFVREVAADLVANRGRSIVAVGDRQPAVLHAIAHRLNAALGNAGKTVAYTTEAPELATNQFTALKKLVDQLNAGSVDTLLILGGNPVYNAPADLAFGDALAKVKNSFHLSLYRDETSLATGWHLPQAHYLEAWSDVRAHDGLYSVAQPLIEPLYAGKTPAELLSIVLDFDKPLAGQALVRQTFDQMAGGGANGGDSAWRLALHDGFWAGSAWSTVTPTVANFEVPAVAEKALAKDVSLEDLEIVFVPSSQVYDGRFANLAWLQELPDFMTKVTWDNVVLVSHATAEKLGVETYNTSGTVARLTLGDKKPVEIPVYVMAGHADGTATVTLGYGRHAAGHVGGSDADNVAPVGVDFYPLRDLTALDFTRGLKIESTGAMYRLATTQDHHAIDKVGEEGRQDRIGELVREATLEKFQEDPNFARHMIHMPEPFAIWKEGEPKPEGHDHAKEGAHETPSELSAEEKLAQEEHAIDGPTFDLFKPPTVDVGHKWGMAIDLTKCTGCNACVIACQAENNVAVVGRDQVRRGREMQWIRIDRYFSGSFARPTVLHQPIPCQQCENAPCEQVCPVAATVHSDEGLNDMVYNRCVGTRYCSNNCPYKVRRFNYFNFQKRTPQPLDDPKNVVLHMLFNPEVTVRSRGVMEKCTYCVQRIQNTKIVAKNEGRPIVDGEIQTACQVACSSQAITFGDLNDPNSVVAKQQADKRAYMLLEELYSKPRTKYLARIRNPNPKLVPATESSHEQPHTAHA